MTNLTSRVEFRAIVKSIVSCLQESLDYPTLSPLTAEQIVFWLREITIADVQAAMSDADRKVA